VGCLVRVEPAEPGDVVAEDRGCGSGFGVGTEGQQAQEVAASFGVEPAGVVGELPDDGVSVFGRPPADRGPLFLDAQILVLPERRYSA
jgi:hypothetical protein